MYLQMLLKMAIEKDLNAIKKITKINFSTRKILKKNLKNLRI